MLKTRCLWLLKEDMVRHVICMTFLKGTRFWTQVLEFLDPTRLRSLCIICARSTYNLNHWLVCSQMWLNMNPDSISPAITTNYFFFLRRKIKCEIIFIKAFPLWLNISWNDFSTSLTEVSCWMISGERQATRIRGLYLQNILRQDIAFFDNETSTGQVIGRMAGDTILIQDAIGEKVT